MRKALAIALMGSLALGLLSSPALAGDPHAVRNRWAGVAIGAGAATLGGLLVGSRPLGGAGARRWKLGARVG
jgi:hypothetical protein